MMLTGDDGAFVLPSDVGDFQFNPICLFLYLLLSLLCIKTSIGGVYSYNTPLNSNKTLTLTMESVWSIDIYLLNEYTVFFCIRFDTIVYTDFQ